MHFSAFFALALTTAQPFDVEKRATSFPIPYIGESVQEYGQQLLSFLSDGLIGSPVTLGPIASLIPSFSIDLNCAFHRATRKTDDLPGFDTDFYPVDGVDGSKIKWLIEADNRSPEDPVILYFHGGGGVLPLLFLETGMWIDMWRGYNAQKNDRLSVAVLDYVIAPREGVWPEPLQQCASVYNELTKHSNNVILAGDSDGGHLALSLLRHIKYPLESVDEVTVKPQGLVTISPWVNVFPNQGEGVINGTYESYNDIDILNADSLSAMGELYIPDEATRTSPALNFWKDYIDWYDLLPDNKENIYVSYGDNEVLKGDIQTWIDIAKLDDSGATIFRDLAGCDKCFFASGTHDNILFNQNDSPISSSIVDFLVERF